jgi:hypothetical protein
VVSQEAMNLGLPFIMSFGSGVRTHAFSVWRLTYRGNRLAAVKVIVKLLFTVRDFEIGIA